MRYLVPDLTRDLEHKKMVFLGGPRQVGKTTVARHLVGDREPQSPRGPEPAIFPDGAYFNWDSDEDRQAILRKLWRREDRLLAFDELHKFSHWRRFVKGLYDNERGNHRILVTGSARLDVYRRGGDSLVGRYHYWRLHPFGLDEVPAGMSPDDALRRFLTVGPFPEPFFENDERQARRWRRERFSRVLRDDVRDLEQLRDINRLELFVDALRRRVGGLVVLANIARDLEVSPATLKHWLEVLEHMYLVFVVYPYAKGLPRALTKPTKVYFFDSGDVIGDDGARFENFVAASLLKRLHFWEDRDGRSCRLQYVRDKEGHEVDFVVVKDDEVNELVETKAHDGDVSPSLRYFVERLNPQRATQLVLDLKRPYDSGQIRVTHPVDVLVSLEP